MTALMSISRADHAFDDTNTDETWNLKLKNSNLIDLCPKFLSMVYLLWNKFNTADHNICQ